MPAHRALGKDIRLVAGRLKRAGNDFFGVAEAVDRGGVDPVDAEVEGAMNRGDGFIVVLRSPGEFPVAAADGPRAKADRCELKVGVSESAKGFGAEERSSSYHILLDERHREWLHEVQRGVSGVGGIRGVSTLKIVPRGTILGAWNIRSQVATRSICLDGESELFHVEQLYRRSPVFMRACAVFPRRAIVVRGTIGVGAHRC